jgi:hypothetical protein
MSLQVLFAPAAPEIATESIPYCPTCGGERRTAFACGHDYELETCRNKWQFWQYGACATVWLDPRPQTSTLGVIYPASYYVYQMDKNCFDRLLSLATVTLVPTQCADGLSRRND